MGARTVILLLLVCATSARAAVEHVIQISVDGLRSDLLQTLIEAGEAPNFARFQTEGAGTNNARVDQTPSPPLDLKLVQTLPNHTSMVTSRPIARDNAFGIEVGHGYTGNVVPPPSETVHNFQGANAYKASTFDVAHDHGLRTGLFVSKSKFVLFKQSWRDAGAADLVPPDDGTDKIDVYVNDPIAADLVAAIADEMQTAPMQYVFLHLRDPDSAGHAHDWGSEEYLEAIRTADAALGDLFTLVESEPTLAGRTALVLTSDHGGGALLPNGHVTYDLLLDALIPLYVWGPGVAAGRSLYTLNAGAYFDPGTTAEISLTDPQPPLRNGDTGNLALALLGLPPIPGSFYNTAQPVVWNDACAECPADLDADGEVAFADLTQSLAAWGLCPPPCAEDLDSSGDIGFEDLTMLLASWGPCPATIDSDGDTVPNCADQCEGQDDLLDTDDDGTPDCLDGCPDDPDKTDPGVCGCGTPDDDTDGDTVPDCIDLCPGADDLLDTDDDGTPDCLDGCPDDPDKTDPGVCGCGTPDDDTDGDTVPDCVDGCPDDPLKTDPGACGCGVADDDTDNDGTPDCIDGCPDDPLKTEPGVCGCDVADDDTDNDGTPDCIDGCPDDPLKTEPGVCGCGVADDDTDDDGTPDCIDGCPDDPLKTEPGVCGCGVADDDTDDDGTPDCLDGCPDDPLKIDPGICGCGTSDDDTDSDTVPDCIDLCPGEDDTLDADTDGVPDGCDGCPDDPLKTEPGLCGCGVPETPDCETDEIFSDDFDRCTVDPAWVEVDPNGGATFELMGAGTSDAYMAITVPPGVNYEAWIGNTAARLMQPTSDVDFQVVAKFDSRPSIANQDQGIIVEQDVGNFLRAEFLSPNNLFVATFTDSSPTIVVNDNISATIAPNGPLWLRVTRTGDLWTVEYSDDGVIWQGSPDTTDFVFDVTVNQVGPHCGSSQDPATDAPGFTTLVDFFFNTAFPIDPEDGTVVGDEQYTFDVQTVGDGMVTLDPEQPMYTCGTTVTLTPIADMGWAFTGWTGDVNSIDNPLVLQAMSDLDITANFAATATAPQIRGIGVIPTDDAAVITWSTDLLATSVLHAGKSAAYELPPISYDGYTTSHTAVLMGLEPGTTYHFQILAESEMGDAARTIDLVFTTKPRTEPAAKTPAKVEPPEKDAGPAATGRPEKKAPSDDDAGGAEPREEIPTRRG